MELHYRLLLPLDDLVALVREFIHHEVSHAGLDRCLRRHGVANVRELQAKAQADAGTAQNKPLKTFKDYEPGFVHVDIKYCRRCPERGCPNFCVNGSYVSLRRACLQTQS